MRMSTGNCFSLIVCVVPIFFLAACTVDKASTDRRTETVYARVLRTGVIRAAYAIYPPYCMKNPNSGKLSGIFVDALETAGNNLGLKVQWTEEVGYGNMIEGLETDRYDIVPSGVFPNASRAKHADFTIPLFYSVLDVYVRSDDRRFDTRNLAKLNDPSTTFSAIDSYVSAPILQRKFPKARVVSHPQLASATDPLLDVIHKKADATLEEPGIAAQFLVKNPHSVRKVNNRPIAIFGNTMLMKIDQTAFKSMLDTTLTEMIHEGVVDDLITKYQSSPGVYYQIADPYRTPSLR
jgi:polar amino acid transport system substrate-binding protein